MQTTLRETDRLIERERVEWETKRTTSTVYHT